MATVVEKSEPASAINNGAPRGRLLRGRQVDAGWVDSRYAWYVLFVLALVYFVGFLDRQILSILAEDIKKDLHLGDEQVGFLYGTAFGIFYALFGYPLGRLADRCRRTALLSASLLIWAAMTAACGFSRNFNELAAARVGVGIGEASANPCAYTLISDWFSRAKRGLAMGIYAGGLYVGSGASLLIGGLIISFWNDWFPAGVGFGLKGWQAAFIAVSLPAFLLAAWVITLREPPRGLADGNPSSPQSGAAKRFLLDVCSVIPPLTLIQALKGGPRALLLNIVGAVIIGVTGYALIVLTGDTLQWLAISYGIYAVFSSAQSLRRDDPPTFALTWGSSTFILVALSFAGLAFANTATFWLAPLSLRNLSADHAVTGSILGVMNVIGGFSGVTFGGRLSDIFYQRSGDSRARLKVGMITAVLPIPFLVGICLADSLTMFYLLAAPYLFFINFYIAAGVASMQELVLPRMRGTANSIYFVIITFVGFGSGPYVIGKVSNVTNSLSAGILSILFMAPITLACLFAAYRLFPRAEQTRLTRAAAAGEPA